MQNQHILFVGETEPAAKPRGQFALAPPRAEPLHDVLAEAIREDTSTHQRRSSFDWGASIGVHIAILAALLILPLYFTGGLDSQKLNLTVLAPPMMLVATPPPPLTSSAAPRPARVVPARFLRHWLNSTIALHLTWCYR